MFSPNKEAASEALRLNWASKNLGPNVDMPAMSVASVAPARQSRMNVGFFSRSQMELHQKQGEETGDGVRGLKGQQSGVQRVRYLTFTLETPKVAAGNQQPQSDL